MYSDIKYEEKVRNNKQKNKCLKKATFDVFFFNPADPRGIT